MTFALRDAVREDLTALAALRLQLYACDPEAIKGERDARVIEELFDEPRLGRIWVIESERVVIGYAIMTFGFSIEFGGRFALLDELLLAREVQGRGIGSQMLERVEALAKEEGIVAVRLEVERTNLGAERLYRRLGFEAHDRNLMTKWLDRT